MSGDIANVKTAVEVKVGEMRVAVSYARHQI